MPRSALCPTLTLIATIALPLAPAAAEGAGHGPDWLEVTDITTRLHIRTAPSATASHLGAVENGTVLRNLGCRSDWCQVELPDGSAGWAAARYLREGMGPDAIPAPEPNYDATGRLPCSLRYGQPTFQCDFGVTRMGAGDADITIFWPGGSGRQLAFREGIPAVGGIEVERRGDLTVIELDEERYEIPDAVVFGG
ncbi:SH3 domain-containing protein [Tritonibacter scottomollicae]|uniref:SH3 domain-containing protein n=1 Tax=Tritonibacter scottomollicae TaxID=483013 RepID=UPI003BAC6063